MVWLIPVIDPCLNRPSYLGLINRHHCLKFIPCWVSSSSLVLWTFSCTIEICIYFRIDNGWLLQLFAWDKGGLVPTFQKQGQVRAWTRPFLKTRWRLFLSSFKLYMYIESFCVHPCGLEESASVTQILVNPLLSKSQHLLTYFSLILEQ